MYCNGSGTCERIPSTVATEGKGKEKERKHYMDKKTPQPRTTEDPTNHGATSRTDHSNRPDQTRSDQPNQENRKEKK